MKCHWSERITFHPGVRGGKPCIRGLAITVAEVLDALEQGVSKKTILERHPQLEWDDF